MTDFLKLEVIRSVLR